MVRVSKEKRLVRMVSAIHEATMVNTGRKDRNTNAEIKPHAFVVSFVRRIFCGLGSSVGIATGQGLEGPGIESRWGRDFPRLFRPSLEPTQPPVQWVPVLSRG